MALRTARSMTTPALTPVPLLLRTLRAEHRQRRAAAAFLGRGPPVVETLPGRVPDNSSSIAGRMESAAHFPCFAAPVSVQEQPLQIGLAHVCGAHQPAGKAAPGNAAGGSHGGSSRFPAVVPTGNISGSHTSKYSGKGRLRLGDGNPNTTRFPHRLPHPSAVYLAWKAVEVYWLLRSELRRGIRQHGCEKSPRLQLHRGQTTDLSSDTVASVLTKAGNLARERCRSIPENLHCHMLRITKAMGLYK